MSLDRLCIAHGGDLSEPSGGTDRIAAFAAGLSDLGVGVTIIAPSPTGDLPARLAPMDFVAVPVGTRGVIDQPIRAVRVSRCARRVATRRDAQLQIVHSTLAGVADLLGADHYVLDMHDLAHAAELYGRLPFGSAVQSLLHRIEGRAVRGAQRVIVVSTRMAEFVTDEWDVPPDHIEVIPNGYFHETVAPYHDAETVAGRVVFLGTLMPKVDAEALRAVADLPDVDELIVIGDGERRADLERRAATHETLKVTGRLPDEEALPLVASASIAINPQRVSTFQMASSPVKLYLYAALGLPMVVTEGPEVVAQLAQLDAAEVVPPDGSFTEAVAALLSDKDRRSQLRTAARSFATRCRWEQRVDQLAEVYGL